MENKKIILFDLDGTLIDSTEAILESFDQAFGYFGVETPVEEKITAEIGHPLDMMLLSLGVSEESVWDYVAVYKKHYRQISREKTFLLAGAEEAVRKASEIARLGIVTTKTAKYSIELLEHMGLMNHFEVLIGREDVEYPKPHPEPVLKALSKFETDTNKCWMIGDTCMDMLSAKSAGIRGIAVTSGYGSKEQLSACCSVITESALDAVASIIRS
ncbi:MAG: HAD family hydrolase [Campylobacterota bacterium]|nr:HAD family hydrolase [Campylobacterota bacterium]